MNVTLLPRRATPADVGAVRDLVREAYSKWVPLIGREPMPMKADYDRAVREHLVWVVEEEGGEGIGVRGAGTTNQIVGVLEVIPQVDHWLIENVAVAPSHQGHGIAKYLMAFAEAQAKERGISELRLYTNERFAANIALYTKLGYFETYRQDFPHLGGTGNITVFMSKQLGVERT